MDNNKYDIYSSRFALADSIQKFLDEPESLEGVKKKVSDALAGLQSNLEDWIQSDMADNLAQFVQRMAEDAIEAMLKGDEETMRKYLKCQKGYYTGRDNDHPVIHGKLFETGAVEIRKKIVDAHAELLKTERIMDLEDQLASVVKQLNAKERQYEALWERCR